MKRVLNLNGHGNRIIRYQKIVPSSLQNYSSWIIFRKMIRVSLIYILVCGILSATIHVVPSVSKEVIAEEEYCRRDYNDYCEEWAAEGECEDDHDYMWLKCPKSCKSCGPKECEGCDECDDRHPSCGLWAWLEDCETK